MRLRQDRSTDGSSGESYTDTRQKEDTLKVYLRLQEGGGGCINKNGRRKVYLDTLVQGKNTTIGLLCGRQTRQGSKGLPGTRELFIHSPTAKKKKKKKKRRNGTTGAKTQTTQHVRPGEVKGRAAAVCLGLGLTRYQYASLSWQWWYEEPRPLPACNEEHVVQTRWAAVALLHGNHECVEGRRLEQMLHHLRATANYMLSFFCRWSCVSGTLLPPAQDTHPLIIP
ncbi:hypothetical protein BD289DRAFT_289153 [Coniella lustricola]|uniref:Uncharacterized protein n=1 Tax=Coniella lustricola TaxID=2025994 RepID=A0A2T3A5M3_9PEZI|nr:hypothetical protein BD289DRAFT_289153 [Coniella lustricola]